MSSISAIPDSQMVTLKMGDLRQLAKELLLPVTTTWVSVSDFKRMHGKTDAQVAYLRLQFPGMFKKNKAETRWLIDIKAYNKHQ